MHAPNRNATPIDLPEKVYGSGDAARFLSDDEIAAVCAKGWILSLPLHRSTGISE
jgi:hypothetical protein